ncbi:MAG: carbohydrate binding domain-containing protein [Candidatus Omnitrophota bacterium]
MNTFIRKIFVVLIIGIFLFSPTISYCDGTHYTTIVESSVSAQGSLTPIVINTSLLDDFDDATGFNKWGGRYLKFHSTIGGENINTSYDSSNRMGSSGYGYSIEYAVPSSGSYAGVKATLTSSDGAKDLSSYEYFTFWVKGSVNDIPVKIEFQNPSGNAYVYITDYLDGGVSTAWQEVKIPLDTFTNLDSLTNVNGIALVFEHDYAVTSGFPTSGTLYIDDIGFGETSLGYVRVDHFGDNWGWSAVGGNSGNLGNHSSSYDDTVYHNASRSLKSQYNITVENYCGMFMLFGGGNDGWTAQECDFSDYKKFVFYARAASAATNPKVFKLEIVDGDGTVSIFITGISTAWKKYTLDFKNVPEINKGTIKQINIIYERTSPGGYGIIEQGGAPSGTLYFDEIQFE